jgi:hypothetical protein
MGSQGAYFGAREYFLALPCFLFFIAWRCLRCTKLHGGVVERGTIEGAWRRRGGGSERPRQPSRSRWMIPAGDATIEPYPPLRIIGGYGSIAAHGSSLSQKLSAPIQVLRTRLKQVRGSIHLGTEPRAFSDPLESENALDLYFIAFS